MKVANLLTLRRLAGVAAVSLAVEITLTSCTNVAGTTAASTQSVPSADLLDAGTVLGTFSTHAQPLQQSIDALGNVWIASVEDNTVIEMSPTGSTLHTYTMALRPDCTVIDAAGNVWICNQLNDSVTEMSPTGTVVGTYATGSGPDSIAFDQRGYAWITDSGATTLTVLNASGTLIGTYSTGSGSPWNVAIDASGNAWTDNYNTGTVSEISPNGMLLQVIAVGSQPQVLEIDSAGYVWVPNGGGVTKLSPSGSTVCGVPLTSYISGVGIGGLAIDGGGNIWAYGANADFTMNGLFEISPTCQVLNYWPYGIHAAYASVDLSGNVWLTNYGNATILKIATGDKGVLTPMVLTLSPENVTLHQSNPGY